MTTDYQEPNLVPIDYLSFEYGSGVYQPPDELLMMKEDSIFDPNKQWDRKFAPYKDKWKPELS